MNDEHDDLSQRLRNEAMEAMQDEPEMEELLQQTVLAPGIVTFEDAVASTISYRLTSSSRTTTSPESSPSTMGGRSQLQKLLNNTLRNTHIRDHHGRTMAQAVRKDVLAVVDRDPACHTILEVVLFFKGFAALVCHRAAHQRWTMTAKRRQQQQGTAKPNATKRSMIALQLQSLASQQFQVDIHPAAKLGAGLLFDHATGIVIGETAVIGDNCTLLHGVTLGGTGKQQGHKDRHPKLGQNVLVGSGAIILGNIVIGNGAKIGAGSIVLKHVPAGATAVGTPAKIILSKTIAMAGSSSSPTSSSSSSLEHMSIRSSSTVAVPPVSVVSVSDMEEEGDANLQQQSSELKPSESRRIAIESSCRTEEDCIVNPQWLLTNLVPSIKSM